MCCLYIILNIVLFCFIYYVPCFSSSHLLQLWFFIPCHHLPTYYTDSKSNALYMSVMSFFMSRNRVFLLDPYLHFLFTLVSFQSCLFSFVLLLLVLCVVYILFQYCFVMFHLLHTLSLQSCLFSFVLLLLVLCVVYILFQYCFVMFHLLHTLSLLFSFISTMFIFSCHHF